MTPATIYLICTSHRSGSNLLCEALRLSSVAGHPAEFFGEKQRAGLAARWGIDPAAGDLDFLRAILARSATPNGVTGAKLLWPQLVRFLERARRAAAFAGQAAPAILNHLLPGAHYLWMTREDKLDQAISMWRAKQTGRFLSPQPESGTPPAYDYEAIEKLRARFAAEDRAWQDFFAEHSLSFTTVTYSEICADYAGTQARVLAGLGLALPPGLPAAPRRLQRQADSLNAEWRARFLAEARLA